MEDLGDYHASFVVFLFVLLLVQSVLLDLLLLGSLLLRRPVSLQGGEEGPFELYLHFRC